MPGSLGEKIGEGTHADIHVWAPGQVVKLFKAGVPRGAGRHEARTTRAVFEAGGPAPEVLDEVTVEGRYGIVLPRLEGPTLLQCLLSGAILPPEAGRILADLFLAVHRTPDAPGVSCLRDWVDAASRIPQGVPADLAAGVLTLIDRLPPASGLCHGDLHSGNVIITAEGPKIIDWAGALRAGPAYDLGRFGLIYTELLPEGVDPQRPGAVNAAVQAEYARRAGLAPEELSASIAPVLPILRAICLAERTIWSPVQRARLIADVEAALTEAGLQQGD